MTRVLPLDTGAARLSGQLSDQPTATGRHPGFADVAIAAIAMQANHLLLTRNLKHFQPLGVACADPLSQQAAKWAVR
jgi:predicted nucleic acid-binding protein